MAHEERYTVTPHPDIELGVARNELEYFVTLPEEGVNVETGLVMCIPGFGDSADSEYQSRKLRPYLADKYNCLAVGVNYFGIELKLAIPVEYQVPDPNKFVQNMETLYGIPHTMYIPDGVFDLNRLTESLKGRGIKRVGTDFRLVKKIPGKECYQSFGFLPALDHLRVLGNILGSFALDKRRIIAYGSSYGGYIALLLGKYAPHTFSAVIDNSGFVNTRLTEIAPLELGTIHRFDLFGGVEFPVTEWAPWTIIGEGTPCYFSDSHRDIRSLLQHDHIRASETRYYLFHSESDAIAPTQGKDRFADILKGRGIEVHYRKVSRSDIDGRLFKSLDHGMNASLRGLFDTAIAMDGRDFCKVSSENDYDMRTAMEFDCGNKKYSFGFGAEGAGGISVRNTDKNGAL